MPALLLFAIMLLAPPSRADGIASREITAAEYKLPAALDEEVLPGVATELWARVFWPAKLEGARPIIFFLHGNHPTCAVPGERPGLHLDSNCEYTESGTCPAGSYPTPSHEGYNYAASELASRGFVVVSVNANRGITCGDAVAGDRGLNLARGRLVLRHLEQWQAWAKQGGAPASLSSDGKLFLNHIDFSRVGLMGHSRGGEGVRAAYYFLRDQGGPWPARLPGARVRAIFEIAATDGQTKLTLNAEDAAWNQLLPMCDGDVAELLGRLPFERMWRQKEEAIPTPKSLFLVWGANHNFFNSEWQNNDAGFCPGQTRIHGEGPTSALQQEIARTSLTAFFEANLPPAGVKPAPSIFDPLNPLPEALARLTRIERDYIPTFDRRFFFPLETFDGLSPARPEYRGQGIAFRQELATPNRARIEWKEGNAGEQRFFEVKWDWPYGPRLLSEIDTLNFRVARDSYSTRAPDPADFQAELFTDSGEVSLPLPISRYATIAGPTNEISAYQTVRIPLRDFGLRIDELARLRGMRLLFPQGSGVLYLTGLHLSSSVPANPATGATPSAPWLAPLSSASSLLKALPTFSAEVGSIEGKPNGQYEITVQSPELFLPGAALPELLIAGQSFTLSRYPHPANLREISFRLSPDEVAALPEEGAMELRAHSGAGAARWRLPPFRKALLLRK